MFSLFLLVFVQATFSPIASATVLNTDNPWAIENTTVVHGSDFFVVSHDINPGPKSTEVQIFGGDCSTELDEEVITVSSGPFLYLSDNITYSLYFDKDKVKTSSIGNEASEFLSFCTAVIGKSQANNAIAHKKTKFNMKFSSEFTIESIETAAADVQVVDSEFTVSVFACECDAEYQCIAKVYELGDTVPEFRVCITPTSEALEVMNLKLTIQNDDYVYTPVEFGETSPTPDSITTITKSGSTTMVSTKLVGGLFESDENSIHVLGEINMGATAGKNSDTESFELQALIQKATKEERGCFTEYLRSHFLS